MKDTEGSLGPHVPQPETPNPHLMLNGTQWILEVASLKDGLFLFLQDVLPLNNILLLNWY